MRILLQRIAEGWVDIEGTPTAKAAGGLLGLVGFHRSDALGVLEPMAAKLANLRIFEDDGGLMNRSLLDSGGDLVLVSQFTLYADCRKGRRPGFSEAMEPGRAEDFFARFVEICRGLTDHLITGKFGASMRVHLVNDGPVTILLDSREIGISK